MTLASGTRLGPYEVNALLGSGGMAEVYRARDVRLGREVALKILPDALSSDAESLARFEREAKTASALNHPHLVTIYDIGRADVGDRPLHFMAMELIRGTTLRHRLKEEPRDVLLRHIADIADGLAKAHDAGVIHRDLKPENVMVSDDDFAKVVDFGLAKHLPRMDGATDERLTAEGFCVGTLGYMAPEQVRGQRDVDARVDIFAIGCILYEAIAKQNPFDGDTAVDTMHRILYDEPPPLQDVVIDRIARRCLSKNRQDRYTSMREVAADVRGAITSRVRRPIRRRFWLTSAAALTFAVAAGGAFLTLHKPRPAIESIAVLPFRNGSGKEELRFLSEGVGSEVVRSLGRVPTLRVIASSSTSRFRDTPDPQKAARELGVDAVLVGNLRTVSGLAVLDTELVKAADGTVIWGQKYERPLTDVVALDREIAGDLCEQVRIELQPERRHTPKPSAHQAYLRGNAEIAKGTPPSLKKALEYFHQAIEINPDYALAYVGLAEAYDRQIVLGLTPTRDGAMQALAAAQKAVSLDESLPEAHWSLARAEELTHHHDGAHQRIKRTLELNPNFAPGLWGRTTQLVMTQQYNEAEKLYQRARALDPLSATPMRTYGVHLGIMRQFDRAIEVLRETTTQFPDDAAAHAYLAMIYSFSGRHAEALATIDKAGATRNPSFAVWKAFILAHAGREAEARAISDRIDAAGMSRHVPAYYRALLASELGDRDAALAQIDQAFREDDWRLRYLPFDPSFDRMRTDRRFLALLEQRFSPRPASDTPARSASPAAR